MSVAGDQCLLTGGRLQEETGRRLMTVGSTLVGRGRILAHQAGNRINRQEIKGG